MDVPDEQRGPARAHVSLVRECSLPSDKCRLVGTPHTALATPLKLNDSSMNKWLIEYLNG